MTNPFNAGIVVAHDGPPVVTPARGMVDVDGDIRDLFAGLTPDEVRVITGLVRAMREHTGESRTSGDLDADARMWAAVHAIKRLGDPGLAAWHIAHAIDQMGES